MFDLRSFGLTDILESSFEIRRLGSAAASMEDAAGAVVRYLYAHLIDKETDQPALALVRLYKTHRFDELRTGSPGLRAAALAPLPGGPGRPCLTLLATAGDEPAWNDRRLSKGHRAIPLHDVAAVAALPMVYELTRQLGFEGHDLVRPHPGLFTAIGRQPGGVFYVPEARGSESVPAQDFVERYGVRSVVGFGGLVPSGYAFAVVMFATVPVSRETAEAFAPLTSRRSWPCCPSSIAGCSTAMCPIRPSTSTGTSGWPEPRRPRSPAARDRHHVVTEQASRLEQARRDAEDRAEALARSQRRLEASEATKAAILNAALDAIITMEGSGRIVDFNPAAERIFGYRRDQAVGRPLGNLIVPPRLREAHAAGLERFQRTGEGAIIGRRIEISAVRADGSEFPVELTIGAVDAGDDQLFSGHVRDITERVPGRGGAPGRRPTLRRHRPPATGQPPAAEPAHHSRG